MGTELEQKYVVESPRPWAVQTRLLSQLSRAGYQVSFLEEKPQRDTYFDTPGEDILKGGRLPAPPGEGEEEPPLGESHGPQRGGDLPPPGGRAGPGP